MNADSNEKPTVASENMDHALTLEEQQLYLNFFQASQRIDTTEAFQKYIQDQRRRSELFRFAASNSLQPL